jgi:glycosyltransferase involved in cell wall biosynthesis
VEIVYINGRFLTQRVTGVQRFAIEVIKALDNLLLKGKIDSEKFSFVILAPPKTKSSILLKKIKICNIGCFTNHLWEQFDLPIYSKNKLLINLCNSGPLIKKFQIITIHDVSVFEFKKAYSLFFRLWYVFLFKWLVRFSTQIVTVSNYSKSEIVRHLKIDPVKIKVIYEGAEHILNLSPELNILDKYELKKRAYFLTIGSINPNKNLSAVISAIDLMKSDKISLVIAGGINLKIFKKTEINLSARVIYLGYVNDNEIRALYQNSLCFIYPSFYEGFGLPPLEAMACGCPVIVSNTSSLPEICGDSAIYCDPYDRQDLADKMNLMINDNKIREDLIRKGLTRISKFTWESTAVKISSLIDDLLDLYHL